MYTTRACALTRASDGLLHVCLVDRRALIESPLAHERCRIAGCSTRLRLPHRHICEELVGLIAKLAGSVRREDDQLVLGKTPSLRADWYWFVLFCSICLTSPSPIEKSTT